MAQAGSGSSNCDCSAEGENLKKSEEVKGTDAAAASIDDQDETKKAFYALPEGVRATVINALTTPMGSSTDNGDLSPRRRGRPSSSVRRSYHRLQTRPFGEIRSFGFGGGGLGWGSWGGDVERSPPDSFPNSDIPRDRTAPLHPKDGVFERLRLSFKRGDDWARGESPDWKVNHNLEWDNLTDLKEIGKGLTCTVYTAKVPGRRGKVIAKVARRKNKGRLEDQAERQLEAEFNVLRQVTHPHVVELLGAGFTNDGRRFILLEHLPEGTLGTFQAVSSREEMRSPSKYTMIKKGLKKLSRDFKLKLIRVLQVAEALEYLQTDAIPGALVLHRDLRPDNVGMGRGGVVKIFDFGLSKALAVSGSGLVIPMVGEAGSLRYAAPEVSMGLPHGSKADVYSWSLLAWSVASAKQPFDGIGRSAFYDRVVIGGERPLLDEHWPQKFRDLLQECWSGEPLERPKISKVVVRMKAIVEE